MPATKRSTHAFTLVELLVVIAIIGILAGFLIPGTFRVLEKGKIADANNTMKVLETSLVDYYTKHGSYPGAYGFLSKKAFNLLPDQRSGAIEGEIEIEINDEVVVVDAVLDKFNPDHREYFVTETYLAPLGFHDVLDYYDPFALEGADTDYDNWISLLEYYPDATDDDDIFGDDQRVIAPAEYNNENTFTYLFDSQRPFLYIPVNLRQFRKAQKIWDAAGGFPTFTDTTLQSMSFPPAKYDSFILASAGVVANTQGLIFDVNTGPEDLAEANYATNYHHHMAAMATYYILTRDRNPQLNGPGDGIRDFDYVGRETGDQEVHDFPVIYYNSKRGPGVLGPIYRVGK